IQRQPTEGRHIGLPLHAMRLDRTDEWHGRGFQVGNLLYWHRTIAGSWRRLLMSTKPHLEQDLFTVEDFFLRVPDGQKADLIDGVIYIASPDTLHSDQLGGFVRILAQGFVEIKKLGKVVGSRFTFELSEIRAPEPDVAFIAQARFHLLEDRKMK